MPISFAASAIAASPAAGSFGQRSWSTTQVRTRKLRISAGWGDQYHHATDGQEVELTGLPEGDYYLVSTSDPGNAFLESDDDNNTAWVKFTLSATFDF